MADWWGVLKDTLAMEMEGNVQIMLGKVSC
jgi:hypothetical protein